MLMFFFWLWRTELGKMWGLGVEDLHTTNRTLNCSPSPVEVVLVDPDDLSCRGGSIVAICTRVRYCFVSMGSSAQAEDCGKKQTELHRVC